MNLFQTMMFFLLLLVPAHNNLSFFSSFSGSSGPKTLSVEYKHNLSKYSRKDFEAWV